MRLLVLIFLILPLAGCYGLSPNRALREIAARGGGWNERTLLSSGVLEAGRSRDQTRQRMQRLGFAPVRVFPTDAASLGPDIVDARAEVFRKDGVRPGCNVAFYVFVFFDADDKVQRADGAEKETGRL